MRIRWAVRAVLAGAVSLVAAGSAGAQNYPSKPIRMVVPFAAGGSNDVVARSLQIPLARELNGTIIVENKPGASTKIGVMDLMNSAPDGYTLMLASLDSTMAYYYSGAFDSKVWEQMTPLGRSGQMAWAMLEVSATSPFKSWADLVAYGKKNPGKLSVGGPAAGGMMNLVALETAKSAGMEVNYIPFKGGGPSGIALLGGHIHYRVAQPTEVFPNVQGGKTRGIAVGFPTRLPEMPDVPTFKELGIEFEVPVFGFDLWGPPNLPPELANRLSSALQRAMKDPAYVEATRRFLYQPVFMGPDGIRAKAKDIERTVGPKLLEAFPVKK